KELKRMAEELAQEITAIEDGIKAEMTERGTDELIIDEYKVTWKPVTSTLLDTSAIKKAMPEIEQQFTKTSTSKRFCLA
ncbi:MAG: hypothetical protein IJ386_00585, partial [Clostridia bacterium]|nr:hypothetical protein [Clostridia bacterium]